MRWSPSARRSSLRYRVVWLSATEPALRPVNHQWRDRRSEDRTVWRKPAWQHADVLHESFGDEQAPTGADVHGAVPHLHVTPRAEPLAVGSRSQRGRWVCTQPGGPVA